MEGEIKELAKFMKGEDLPTFARMIDYFSVQGKYLHPRELKKFWESLTEEEKLYYHFGMRDVV